MNLGCEKQLKELAMQFLNGMMLGAGFVIAAVVIKVVLHVGVCG